MTTQTEAQRLAYWLEQHAESIEQIKAAAELCRLEQSSREGWRYADELEQERKRLKAANAELLTALVDVSYTLEKARIWGGMDWTYNPLHPVHYLPARDKARAVIEKHGGAA